jgi:N-acetyl-beta-hexosaminidase
MIVLRDMMMKVANTTSDKVTFGVGNKAYNVHMATEHKKRHQKSQQNVSRVMIRSEQSVVRASGSVVSVCAVRTEPHPNQIARAARQLKNIVQLHIQHRILAVTPVEPGTAQGTKHMDEKHLDL